MIRTRFAPSPTGHLHIGGLRAALFNYIFAKRHGGSFSIRIEDTDRERSKEEFTKGIIDAFSWCDITSDTPIVFQSERNELYQQYIEKLLASDAAYYDEVINEEGEKSIVIKCRVPKDDAIEFHDMVHGPITFQGREFDDFIIVRSDGSPLYNAVVVFDDIAMGITHVIRGEEHIPNTPKQLLLYRGLNQTPPQFAHLPLILGTDGKKLSKRDAATAVIDYKQEGFLPEALCSYLLRLGWSHNDNELISLEEAIAHFTIERVHKTGAMFDKQKLLWTNQQYLKQRSPESLFSYAKDFFTDSVREHREEVISLIPLLQEKSKTVLSLASFLNVIFSETIVHYPEEILPDKKAMKEIAKKFLSFLSSRDTLSTKESWKHSIEQFSKQEQIEQKILYTFLRVVMLGEPSAPNISEIMAIVGTTQGIKKITSFIDAEA